MGEVNRGVAVGVAICCFLIGLAWGWIWWAKVPGESPTHQVKVWCPDKSTHIDLRLPAHTSSLTIEIAAVCGTPKEVVKK